MRVRALKTTSIESLDLATVKRPKLSLAEYASLLIHSLRANYFSYGRGLSKKTIHRELRSQDDYYGKGFFALPRVSLPNMKQNSRHTPWLNLARYTYQLLDGADKAKYILMIKHLENKLLKIAENADQALSADEALEAVLHEFEVKSGFSSVVKIQPDDGNGGILSASQFKNLLMNGHPLDDCGAGAQHGRITHRLQFYLLGEYINNNFTKLFSDDDITQMKESVSDLLPEVKKISAQQFRKHLISIFYRLLGTEEFNNCFDWNEFFKHRRKLNIKCNDQPVPDELNAADIWVQLFDRYGYAGCFSVPSTFGILQDLGLFSHLPTLGIPRTNTNSHLKAIMDVTPLYTGNKQFFQKKMSPQPKTIYHKRYESCPNMKSLIK